MKQTLIITTLLLYAALAKAQTEVLPKDAFTVTAYIEGLEAPQIYLTYGGFHNSKIDTTQVAGERFSFAGNIEEPVPAMIFTPDYKVKIDLYVAKGKISVIGSYRAMDSLQIEGPPATNEFVSFNGIIMANRNLVNRLNREA